MLPTQFQKDLAASDKFIVKMKDAQMPEGRVVVFERDCRVYAAVEGAPAYMGSVTFSAHTTGELSVNHMKQLLSDV